MFGRKNNDITSDYGFTEASIKSIVTQISKVIPTTPVPIKPGIAINIQSSKSYNKFNKISNMQIYIKISCILTYLNFS